MSPAWIAKSLSWSQRTGSPFARFIAKASSPATQRFETELPDWKKWDGNHRPDCRLLAQKGKQILGWAALRPVSARLVYCGVAEVSVYVAAAARANGVGKALLKALVEESERHGVWTLQAGIFPENVASVAIHKSCGFREVGIRYRMGKMGDTWRDVLLLERRSSQVAA
jgi:L-amino acid N-acyltransferase YncA